MRRKETKENERSKKEKERTEFIWKVKTYLKGETAFQVETPQMLKSEGIFLDTLDGVSSHLEFLEVGKVFPNVGRNVLRRQREETRHE